MPTKIELTLEQSQQGVSNDVLVSIEGVEELKRNSSHHGSSDAMHNPSQPFSEDGNPARANVKQAIGRDNDKRNFDVHKPFRFKDFGVTEHDGLGAIIPNKKNKVVEDLMASLQKQYERLKLILGEIGISPSLPALEQVPSLSLGRKSKAQELEPKVCILGLECNRSLPEGVHSEQGSSL
nr:hypothetical protein [Tanacetum cinerariifolium]